MKKIIILGLVINICLNGFCSPSPVKKNSFSQLKISNWNTETFFDGENDGSEYSEYLKSKKWGKELYLKRLERLVEVINALDSDVFVMEEIENKNVLQDLSNYLSGEWNRGKAYRYGCFVRDEKSSIGLAVISRFPLDEVKVHSFDAPNEKVPPMRPLLQLNVNKDGKKLALLVNHWKSMSGGELNTEKWRCAQESILARVMENLEEQKIPYVAIGDFNRDILKFSLINEIDPETGEESKNETDENNKVSRKNVLIKFGNGFVQEKDGIKVMSPWFDENPDNLVMPGSYKFKEEWSRIDNMFFGGGANCKKFNVETEGPWYNSEFDKPFSFSLWNGKGYSDHLPISASVIF